jgi:hypothetical protein
MDCQSGCPLKALFSHISHEPTCSQHALPRRKCLNVGRVRRSKSVDIVVLQGHTVRSRLAHGMQTVKSYVRTQSPSVKEGCGT